MKSQKRGKKFEIQKPQKTSREPLVNTLCTKFQTCTAIGRWLKVGTNGQGAGVGKKKERKKNNTPEADNGHSKSFITVYPEVIFQALLNSIRIYIAYRCK